jgi:NADP-dependent 3-hydroxy acid dehydrogenase YdfG
MIPIPHKSRESAIKISRGEEMKVPLAVDCKDRVAVVTGGGGVLCGMFAEALGQCGARVAVLDLRKENAEAVVQKIKIGGGNALALEANVLDREALKRPKRSSRKNLATVIYLLTAQVETIQKERQRKSSSKWKICMALGATW